MTFQAKRFEVKEKKISDFSDAFVPPKQSVRLKELKAVAPNTTVSLPYETLSVFEHKIPPFKDLSFHSTSHSHPHPFNY